MNTCTKKDIYISKQSKCINCNLHSNTSILDFLHAKRFKIFTGNTTFLLGETKRIISVISWNRVFLLPLAIISDAFEPSSNNEDLEKSSIWNGLDGIKRSHLGKITKSNINPSLLLIKANSSPPWCLLSGILVITGTHLAAF